MRLKELKARGAFVDRAPVAKELTWVRKDADGKELTDTFTVFVIRQSFGTIERSMLPDPSAPDRSTAARFIAECIRLGDDASEALTYEDAYSLDPSLATLFVKAINEVNGAKN